MMAQRCDDEATTTTDDATTSDDDDATTTRRVGLTIGLTTAQETSAAEGTECTQ